MNGPPWLSMGSYSVRMKRTASGKLFKSFPGLPGSLRFQQGQKQNPPNMSFDEMGFPHTSLLSPQGGPYVSPRHRKDKQVKAQIPQALVLDGSHHQARAHIGVSVGKCVAKVSRRVRRQGVATGRVVLRSFWAPFFLRGGGASSLLWADAGPYISPRHRKDKVKAWHW